MPATKRPPGPVLGTDLERCIYCQGTHIRREGVRVKKRETLQLWFCRDCACTFTAQREKGRRYPIKVILEALMLYYRGETRERTSARIKDRFGVSVPARTLSRWLADYRGRTAYARLRSHGLETFRPDRIIRSVRLHHQQTYLYGIHRGKVAALLSSTQHARLRPLENYLTGMAESCPHYLFTSVARASQGKIGFDLDAVEIKAKRNHACQVADLVLQAVTHNKRRHDELQRFMLTTDSATVAVEVPIYLTPEDIAHFRRNLGFHVPIQTDVALTGHIDFVQVRQGAIHILDYKPNARLEKPIAQLMVYALALSRRTGLKLYDFVCAWFDEHAYFEFYPLHVVHKRAGQRQGG